MIEFQDVFEDPHALEEKVAGELRLLRALANFHVGEDASSREDLENQRDQLLQQVRQLQKDFARLVEIWQGLSADLSSHVAYDPEKDTHAELLTKFIRLVVPREMQPLWRPDSFTGSLLVFFENGKIESSSLIEKKDENSATKPENGRHEEEATVHVVEQPFNAFTVLKAPNEDRFNVYFTLRQPARVFLIVYNDSEQVVRQIEAEFDQPGDYTLIWDGRDDRGNPVPKGRYYFQLQIGSALSELKVVDLT